VLAQDGHGVTVDADHPGSAALGGSFDALAAYHGGGAAEGDLGCVQVHRLPAEVEQLAAAGAGIGRQVVEGEQPVRSRSAQEGVHLPGGPHPGWFGPALPGPLRLLGRVDGKELLNVHGIFQGLTQRAVDMRHRPRRQWPAITATVLGQLPVQLGDHGRAQCLQPRMTDAGNACR